MLDTFLLDTRHAVRALARSPIFVVVAVMSLGTGIGVNTAVFSWMDSLVLRPFPALTEPGRVVGLETVSAGGVESPVSYPTLQAWREESRSFSGVSAWTITRVAGRAQGDANATPLIAMAVSGSYFEVLGVVPALGRVFGEADERSRARVVVLGHAHWHRQYGANPAVVGRALVLNGLPFTIMGVAAARFAGTYVGVVPDAFVPVTVHPDLSGQNLLDDRRARAFQSVARLGPGVTRGDAQRELDAIARRLSHDAGDRPVTGAVVKDIRTQYLGGLLLPLLSATIVVTGLLLAIACANVASLLLVRSQARRAELSLRMALGASRWSVARVVFLEIGIVTVVGAAVGLGMAQLARGVLSSLFPMGPFPMTLPIALNMRVLRFAIGAAVLVATICAWLPVSRAVSVPPSGVLRAGNAFAGRASMRMRSVVVSLQLGVSLLSLVTSGLFVRAVQRAASVNVGFADPHHVLLVGTDLAATRLDDTTSANMLRQLLTRVRSLPGVQTATAANVIPLGLGGVRTVDVRVDGFTPAIDESMAAVRILAAADYARTMGIPVLAGRDLTDADRHGSTPVALVNATFARRFWPNGSALGRRVDGGHGWATVVGVVADGKYGALTEAPQLAVYFPLDQWLQRTLTLHVRTAGDPLAIVVPIRNTLSSVNGDLAVLQPRTLAAHTAGATFVHRTGVRVVGVFGAAALALAALGLYGALAFTVAARAQELAIRTALGARGRDIAWSVGRQAAGIAGWGGVAGTGLALLAARALRAQIPGIEAIDIATYLAALGVLMLAVAAAAWLPARRAARADSLAVLRGR